MKKQLLEYKINFWTDFFGQIFYLILGYSFLMLWQTNFGEIINWSKLDYIFYFTLIDFLWCIAGIFFWNKRLFGILVNGSLNDILMRPLKPFLGIYLNNFEPAGILMTIINLPIIITLLILKHISIINLLIGTLFSLIIIITFITTHYFFDSFEFRYKKSGLFFWQFYFYLHDNFTNYPFAYFAKLKLKIILLFIPIVYISSLILPIMNGTSIWNFKLQLTILGLFNLISIIGIFLNWHFGLKKYEAYG